MPIQAPQWLDYLLCSVCCHEFDTNQRLPVTLSCGHTMCTKCLDSLRQMQCPFDQSAISDQIVDNLPPNSILLSLIGVPDLKYDLKPENVTYFFENILDFETYKQCMETMKSLAHFLHQNRSITFHNYSKDSLSKPVQKKILMLINCQLLESGGRIRFLKTARILGEKIISELISLLQNSKQLTSNLWVAIRARGCQFLGPAMQEDVLKLILTALENGTALSRKVLVMFIVQKLEPVFLQASKTSIGHVVQLLYRASCFNLIKRDGESSLMQLKEEFASYESLRRVHDMQIIQIANEAGLRIVPEQWSSLLYGDMTHKSEMQSIIDKLQTPQSFAQSIQELIVILQRAGDPLKMSSLRGYFQYLSSFELDEASSNWSTCVQVIESLNLIIRRVIKFMVLKRNWKSFNCFNRCAASVSRCEDKMCSPDLFRDNCRIGDSAPTEINSVYPEPINEYKTDRKCSMVIQKPQPVFHSSLPFDLRWQQQDYFRPLECTSNMSRSVTSSLNNNIWCLSDRDDSSSNATTFFPDYKLGSANFYDPLPQAKVNNNNNDGFERKSNFSLFVPPAKNIWQMSDCVLDSGTKTADNNCKQQSPSSVCNEL